MEASLNPATSRRRVPLDDVLSNIGIGWFQYRLWWICGLGFSAAAVEVVLFAFVMPELRTTWKLSEYQLGSMMMVMSMGSIFGELTFGMMADRIGRRFVFMVTVMIIIVFGLLSSFAPSPWIFCGLRFLVGFGYGGCIAVDFTLYSEFLPTEGRGKMLFMLSVFWPLGQILTCLLAMWLIPGFGWRTFVAACTIPIILTACARPLIPESPRWLLLQGRNEEATLVCLEMAALNGRSAQEIGLGEDSEVYLENETSSLESSKKVEKSEDVMTAAMGLFTQNLWRTTCGLIIYGVALNYITYGTLTLMPTLLAMKGIAKSNIYRSMLLNSVAQIPGCMAAAFLATYYGRRYPMQVIMLVVAASLTSFGFAQSKDQVMVSTMIASGFTESAWAMFHVYAPEVYPTDVRAFATGFLSATGSLMACMAPMVSAWLLTLGNPIYAILMFSGIAVFASISSHFLLHIETKDRDLSDVIAEPTS